MKKKICLLIISVIFFSLTKISSGQNINLTIKISGIEKITGKVLVGLYNNADNFPKEYKEFKKASITVNANVVKYTFVIPVGNYAIALFHDEDSDGEMDKNFLGIPQEKYGFSNNVEPVFSAPTFDETKINVTKDTTIEIKLITY